MKTRAELFTDFINNHCASLCMDDEEDVARMVELVLGFGALCPDLNAVKDMIKESINRVHAAHLSLVETRYIKGMPPDFRLKLTEDLAEEISRNAAQAVASLFVQ